jgi:hypothetical protein
MTDNSTLWEALQTYLPKKTWIPMEDILATLRSRVILDEEDLERKDPPLGSPQWESNLRSLLRAKTRAGNIRARRRQNLGH